MPALAGTGLLIVQDREEIRARVIGTCSTGGESRQGERGPAPDEVIL